MDVDYNRNYEDNHLILRESVLAVFHGEKTDESLEALSRVMFVLLHFNILSTLNI